MKLHLLPTILFLSVFIFPAEISARDRYHQNYSSSSTYRVGECYNFSQNIFVKGHWRASYGTAC